MDQHPIPRQITSFEFKLIGFMTLKQFIYLIVAFPIAYIIFSIFPIPILNILLAVAVVAAGIAAAFLPIQDRPLDVWVRNMWKRLQQPTQYYYHKHNDSLYFLKDLYFLADPHHMLAHIESREKLSQYLAMTKQRPRANYRKKQVGALLQSPTTTLQTQPASHPIVPGEAPVPTAPNAKPVTAPVSTEAVKAPAPQNMVQALLNEHPKSAPAVVPFVVPPAPVSGAPADVPASIPAPTSPAPAPVASEPVSPAPVETAPAETPVVPEPAPAPPAPATPEPTPFVVKPVIIPPSAPMAPVPAPTPQVAVPQAPASQGGIGTTKISSPAAAPVKKGVTVTGANGSQPFFMGVIKNSKKIPLPGVLIYVKDPAGTPLRLMKTNPHGVFATYNPIPSGSYSFEIKDPNGTYFFDTMKVPVKDSNPMPFEFQSKEIL